MRPARHHGGSARLDRFERDKHIALRPLVNHPCRSLACPAGYRTTPAMPSRFTSPVNLSTVGARPESVGKGALATVTFTAVSRPWYFSRLTMSQPSATTALVDSFAAYVLWIPLEAECMLLRRLLWAFSNGY